VTTAHQTFLGNLVERTLLHHHNYYYCCYHCSVDWVITWKRSYLHGWLHGHFVQQWLLKLDFYQLHYSGLCFGLSVCMSFGKIFTGLNIRPDPSYTRKSWGNGAKAFRKSNTTKPKETAFDVANRYLNKNKLRTEHEKSTDYTTWTTASHLPL